MKKLFAAMAIAACAFPAMSADDAALSAEQVEQIMAMLAEMKCEMAPEDIEVEDDGIELDDVFCADGQYDIELNEDLEVVNRRKE